MVDAKSAVKPPIYATASNESGTPLIMVEGVAANMGKVLATR